MSCRDVGASRDRAMICADWLTGARLANHMRDVEPSGGPRHVAVHANYAFFFILHSFCSS
jgi:6-phosphogluconolactonase (cycloisomerase 2 family)